MNKSFKIFLMVIALLIIAVMGALYYQIFIKKDFLIIDTSNTDAASTNTPEEQ